MKLGYTLSPGRGDTDLLLVSLADALAARGIRCVGTVQINTERDPGRACDMDVRVLPDGPVHRISQSLGEGSRGCRLDAGALEICVADTMERLTRLGDAPTRTLLIVNKFGKHEALGRGFRDVIATALAADIPVIAGVNALNLEAFLAFSGGVAERIAPNAADLLTWAESTLDAPTTGSAPHASRDLRPT